jgi:retinol dehydrogenase-14
MIGGKTPDDGAQTSIYLASSTDLKGITGRYYVECQPVRSSAVSYDTGIAKKLWEISETMVGISK